MKEFLLNLLNKFWLKPKGIPAAFVLAAICCIGFISTIDGLDGVTLCAKDYYCISIVFGIIWSIYAVNCLYADRLPRAPKDHLAVLFCIDAESDKLYAAAKSKLVSNFTASLADNSNIRFKALCVSRESVSKYNLTQTPDALRLLHRTRSVILVNVRYTTDDVDAPEKFSLKINYGVRHPQIDKTAEKVLTYDMSQLGAPLRNRRFDKKETIEVFDFSTQALVFVCQYIIGFVLLLAGDAKNAVDLLKLARETALKNNGEGFDTKNLTQLVDDRLFAAHLRVATGLLKSFQEDYSMEHLYEADTILEQVNHIRPGTYSYNLLKAYVLVMLYQDGASARKCIEKCKQSNQYQDWTYSDAFLSAYAGNSPGRVISKYTKAFKAFNENLLELADYIEVVLEREPEKATLHLALGILYNRIENHKLANYHLSVYLEQVEVTDCRANDKIKQLIETAKCGPNCNRNCSNCDSLEVI